MKNPRAIAMMVLSVALGLAAVALAAQWINRQSSIAAQKVVVAAMDIDLGARLTPEMLKVVDWPAGSMPEGALNDPRALDGRVLRVSVQRGEAVLDAKLAPQGTKGGLSAVVAEGKRAMTVRVNDVIGVAGFALPGNYVDILVNTTDDPQGKQEQQKDLSISKIVLEHILVLAVAQEAGRDETKPKVVNAVTLEVSPEQAERLDLARSVGTLSLVLRNQVDPQPAQTAGITKQILLRGNEEAAPAVAPPPPAVVKKIIRKPAPRRAPAAQPAVVAVRDCVEIVRGTSRQQECF